MTSTLVELPIPPVPSAQSFDTKGSLVSQPWQQWFVNVRDKINIINTAVVGISILPKPVGGVNSYLYWNGTTWGYNPVLTGVTAGTYTNVTLTILPDGRISAASNGAGGGGILPVVTGEISAGQPVFVYLDNGSLVYTQVQ